MPGFDGGMGSRRIVGLQKPAANNSNLKNCRLPDARRLVAALPVVG